MLSRISETEVTCTVVEGGNLKSRKGINVPELQIDPSRHPPPSPATPKVFGSAFQAISKGVGVAETNDFAGS